MWPDKNSPGYGSFVKNVVNGLENNGFFITSKAVIIGKPEGKLKKIKSYLRFYIDILSGFFKKYDFIYIHFPNQAVPLLSILFKIRRQKIVVNYHGEDLLFDSAGYTGLLGRATEKFCKKYATKIVVPSTYYADIVESKGIASKDKILVSPSGGISEDIFFPNIDSLNKSQEILSPVKIAYIGRLEPEKGIITFLEVLLLLKKRNIKFNAQIVGYGSKYDFVESFLSDNNLESFTSLSSGIQQSKLGEIYRNLDLFIFPSENQSESLGLTGIEAMACGIPVIGSNIGGIKTYLKNGYNGFLVSPGNPEDIVESVCSYLSLPEEIRRKLKSHAIETGKKFYYKNVCQELALNFQSI